MSNVLDMFERISVAEPEIQDKYIRGMKRLKSKENDEKLSGMVTIVNNFIDDHNRITKAYDNLVKSLLIEKRVYERTIRDLKRKNDRQSLSFKLLIVMNAGLFAYLVSAA